MMASCPVLTVKKLLKTRVMKINPPIANGIRTSASIACLPATDRWVTSELYRKADAGNVAILWTGGTQVIGFGAIPKMGLHRPRGFWVSCGDHSQGCASLHPRLFSLVPYGS